MEFILLFYKSKACKFNLRTTLFVFLLNINMEQIFTYNYDNKKAAQTISTHYNGNSGEGTGVKYNIVIFFF